ncbi:MAG: MBL fold metallo-hydrolase [Acidobacteria bacterium]|jgi:flavorubredoxin|nr:MAG: MBL fold metallo-hydrolase [Acidobacteriota bacterium]
MPKVTEIAPDLYRISVLFPEINLQFNHFLVADDEPLLFHTGLRRMFYEVREGVASIIDPTRLRWISWSHFESDECGALNEWLAIAPHAEPACNMVGALVNVNDFAARPARILGPEDVLTTGKHRFRYLSTPQLPHGWDAGVLFEETNATMLCSDLFHQDGDVEALTHSSVLDRVATTLTAYQKGPLANYVPYTGNTGRILRKLAAQKPRTLAIMHGSSYSGDGEKELLGLADVMKRVLGEEANEAVA